MSDLFISDLHLSPERPDITRQFRAFLEGPALDARRLYILGDLFDYWAGDDDMADPFNAGIVSALAACGARVEVLFMHGNRDFLAGPAFASASGLRLLEDPLVADIGGRRTLLMHGDTLCTDDAGYQRFRAEVRTPAWADAFLALPLAERRRTIASMRAQSEAQKRIKPMDIMDANPAAVEAALRRHGCERIIHGHTHRPARHVHRVDGRDCERWVLADWYGAGSALSCGPQGCAALALD